MKKIVVIVLVLFLLQSINTSYAEAPDRTLNQYTTEELVSKYAHEYNVSEKQMLAVMDCESQRSMHPTGSNDGGKAHGIYQYHIPTFDDFSNRLGEKLDLNSKSDQIKLTAFAFSEGLAHHWSCYRKT